MHLTNPIYALFGVLPGLPSPSKSLFLIYSVMAFGLTSRTQSSSVSTADSDAIGKIPQNLVPSTTVSTFIRLTGLQNLVIDSVGDIIVNSLFDGRIWRVSPNGSNELLGQVPGQAFSVAEAPESGFIVVGLKLDGVVSVFHILASGEVKTLIDVEGAVFPNGLESFEGGQYLFADSVRGIIWEFNYWQRSFSVFLQHELLTPIPGNWEPGANGVRIFGNKLFISNSNRKILLSVQLCDNKPMLETLKIVKENIAADDFDFDEAGNVYITTHPLNVVMCLASNGTISVIATGKQGVNGNTACRFGRKSGDEKSLYVVADGGIFNPSSSGFQPASVVRLDINTKGAPGGQKKVASCAEKQRLHEEH